MAAEETVSFSSSLDFELAEGNCSPNHTFYLDDPYEASLFLYQPIDKIVTFYIVPVITVFGVLCNLAFVLVVYKVPFMQTPSSCYLVQLAVSDILFLVVAAAEKIALVSLTPINVDRSPFGFVPGCILLFGLLEVPYFASLFFITLVTFDRYIAICRPLRMRLYTKTRRAKLSVFFWATAVVFTACLLPAFFSRYCVVPPELETSEFPHEILICSSDFVPDWVDYLQYPLQTLPFFVTLVINVFFYIAILRAIRRSETMRGTLACTKDQSRHARHSVDRMVLVTGSLFFLLLSPLEFYFIVTTVIDVFDHLPVSAEQENTVIWVFRLLSYINSAINPVVYNVTNSRYRDAFKAVFWNWRKTSKPESFTKHSSNDGHAQRHENASTSFS